MRPLLLAIAATVAAGAFLVPATAQGQIVDVTVGDARVQADTQTITVPLIVTCEAGNTVFGALGTVLGRQGNSLFHASLSAFPSPQPPCTGSPQPLELTGFVFEGTLLQKNGKGTLSNGLLGVSTPSGLVVESFGPLDVKIRKR